MTGKNGNSLSNVLQLKACCADSENGASGLLFCNHRIQNKLHLLFS